MARKKPKPPSAFVLDASVTLAWFFEDERDAYADAVANALIEAVAVVPSLWHLELANALRTGEKRNRTTPDKVDDFLTLLQALPITVDDETVLRAWSDTLNLARTHSLSAYDAAYLEVALRRQLPLATLDQPLQKAAQDAGIVLFAP